MARVHERFISETFLFFGPALLALFIGAIAPAAASAQDTTTKISIEAPAQRPPLNLRVTAGLGAQDIMDELVRSSGANGYLIMQGSQEILPKVSARMRAGFYFAENSAADLYGREGGSGSSVGIEHAHISIRPVERAVIDIGVLSRSFSTVPYTFRTDGTLGAQESYLWGEKSGTYLELSTSQILPSSSTAEKRAGKDRETPLLLMAGGDLGLKLHELTTWNLKAQYFQYSNLTADAAHRSRQHNTVRGFGADNSQFAYGFEGFQLGSSLITQWTGNLKTTLNGGYILNQLAAPGTGKGYAVTVGADYKTSKYVISPLVGLYYNERNVLPAVYTSSTYGRTNRIATNLTLRVSMPQENLSFYGRYVQADLIEEEFSLSDRRVFSLGMEATYDVL